jgi:hypothetical protein
MIEKIKLTGRFAVLVLMAIFLEGMLTLGGALQFENYNAVAWIVQALILVLCIWGAIEWTEDVKDESKSW